MNKSIAFIADKGFTLSVSMIANDNEKLTSSIKASQAGSLSLERVYVTTPEHILALVQKIPKVKFSKVDLTALVHVIPTFKRSQQFKLAMEEKPKQVAVINGFGSGIGDSIVGISAFKLMSQLLQLEDIRWDIYLRPDRYDKLAEIYHSQLPNANIQLLPASASKLSSLDYVVDFAELVSCESFNQLNLFDFYLEFFGVNHREIASSLKRSQFELTPSQQQLARVFIAERAEGKQSILLSLDTTSPIRDIPQQQRNSMIEILYSKGYALFADKRFGEYSANVNDISGYCQQVGEFAAIIKACDYVISADTLAYHLSDAFHIKTLTFFTTIEPVLRSTYYVNNTSVVVPGARQSRLWGMHKRPKDFRTQELELLWQDASEQFLKNVLADFLGEG